MVINELLDRYENITALMRTSIKEKLAENGWSIGYEKDEEEDDDFEVARITIHKVESSEGEFDDIWVYDKQDRMNNIFGASEYYIVLQFIQYILNKRIRKMFEGFEKGDIIAMEYELGTLVFEFDSIKIESEISVYIYRKGLVKPNGEYVPGDGFDYVNYFPEQDKIRKATEEEIKLFNEKKSEYDGREKEA